MENWGTGELREKLQNQDLVLKNTTWPAPGFELVTAAMVNHRASH